VHAIDEDRLGTLTRRLDDAESKVRTLTTEWLDTLDRIERILGRLTKRAQRADAPPDVASPQVNGETAEDPVQRIIRIRRNRG